MKNVVGTFHKIQKAYYQYCYQAVEPDGIKMSEMACILSLYNSAPKDTARDIIEYSCLSPGMVSRSLESLRKSGLIEGYRDQEDSRYIHLRLLPRAAPILDKLTQAQTKFITCIAGRHFKRGFCAGLPNCREDGWKSGCEPETQRAPHLKTRGVHGE